MKNKNEKEILERMTKLNDNQNYRNIVVNEIIDLEEEYYKLVKLNIKYAELFNNKKSKLIKDIKKIKNQIKTLETVLLKCDNEVYSKYSMKKLPLSKNQIILLDFKYKINSYRLFTLLRLENNIKPRIKILNELRNIYINLSRNIIKEDYESKDQIKKMLSYLSKTIKEEKSNLKNYRDDEFLDIDDEKINNNMYSDIYSAIMNGENLFCYEIEEVIDVFFKILRKYKVNDKLIISTNNIIEMLKLELLDDKNKYGGSSLVKIQKIKRLQKINRNLFNNIDMSQYDFENKMICIYDYLTELIQRESLKLKNKNFIQVNKNNVSNSHTSITNYSINELLHLLKSMIKNKEINEDLIKYADYIIHKFNNIDEINIEILNSLNDTIKFEMRKYEKGTKERLILKQISKKIKKYKKLFDSYDDNIDSVSEQYLYDLICILLYDETGYLPIKKILEKYDKAINAKLNSNHILEYIFAFFLDNYEKLITNNKVDYIKVEYLKEVYYLFVTNPKLNIDKDVQNKLDDQINLFINRITNNKMKKKIIIDGNSYDTIFVKKEKTKNNIIQELNDLRESYIKQQFSHEIINNDILDEDILYSDFSYMQNNLIDLTNEKNILLDNNFIAYNFKTTTSSSILRISIPDISNFIKEDTMTDDYMYNQMLEGEKLNDKILNQLKFKTNKESNVITFKISFDNYNNPIDLYIYKSKIKPVETSKNDRMLSDMKKVLSKTICKEDYQLSELNNNLIEEISRILINELYLELSQKNNIPIIYSGVEDVKRMKTSVYSNMVPILNKLTKEQAHEIYEIMNSNLGEFHYSDKPFRVEGQYDLGLIGEPNYILLKNQRIIKSLILNGINKGIEQYDNKRNSVVIENKTMIDELNKSINYKDIYDRNLIIKKSLM